MKMKDVIPTMNHRLYKPEYLNRLVSIEEKRIRICRLLTASGISPYKAYEVSKKEMIK
jgi:hypothetical protein|tara:strand:+ start:280 stop:453 length:174 start_codon:yes stop_codon:yes gene_type:complete